MGLKSFTASVRSHIAENPSRTFPFPTYELALADVISLSRLLAMVEWAKLGLASFAGLASIANPKFGCSILEFCLAITNATKLHCCIGSRGTAYFFLRLQIGG